VGAKPREMINMESALLKLRSALGIDIFDVLMAAA